MNALFARAAPAAGRGSAVSRAQARAAAAEAANARLSAAIEALPDAFVLYDADDRLVICNEQYRRTYDFIADVIVPGATFESIIRTAVSRGLQPEAVGREEEWVAERMARHRAPEGAIEQELPGDRWLRIFETRTPDGDTVGFRVDITELKRQQRRLEELAAALDASKRKAEHEATHDPLTGLANRRALDAHLAELRAELGPQDVIFALHIDLDRFKRINDMLGHAAGDHVLRHVADRLRAAVRAADFVARVGGDEFVVVSHDGATAAAARAAAERIVAAMARPVIFEGAPCRFGA
ncbi:MAG: diguanylate cyclase, partial [Pseudomonadota bacterium]